ncbi:MAG: SDR family NAD(P)-dependent oxidoreductase [Oxalobacteraceae bacterium]|nr:MAG: SDR family NAD(P)-dependent oxidoreductase [Oxalobacteraceae bacterium]
MRRIAFVTGASSGIGRATTNALLRARWGVAAFDRRPAPNADVREDALACAGDVTQPEDLEGALNTCVRHFGRLDAVVANAGVHRLAQVTLKCSRRSLLTCLPLGVSLALSGFSQVIKAQP